MSEWPRGSDGTASDEWKEGTFKSFVRDRFGTVSGLTRWVFGIHWDEERKPSGWVVTYTPTGHVIWNRLPFTGLETAKTFVDRILPLGDWSNVAPDHPPVELLKSQLIAEELLLGEGRSVGQVYR